MSTKLTKFYSREIFEVGIFAKINSRRNQKNGLKIF